MHWVDGGGGGGLLSVRNCTDLHRRRAAAERAVGGGSGGNRTRVTAGAVLFQRHGVVVRIGVEQDGAGMALLRNLGRSAPWVRRLSHQPTRIRTHAFKHASLRTWSASVRNPHSPPNTSPSMVTRTSARHIMAAVPLMNVSRLARQIEGSKAYEPTQDALFSC